MTSYFLFILAIIVLGMLGGFFGGWLAMVVHIWRDGIPLAQKPLTISRLRSRSTNIGLVLGVMSLSFLSIVNPNEHELRNLGVGFLVVISITFIQGITFLYRANFLLTPYDDITLPNREDHLDRALTTFDVFISYRADNERLARIIGDWLLSNGLLPWLDEYLILLTDRTCIDEALSRGLAATRRGIVLVDQKYQESDWTKKELKGLLQNCPADHILFVNLDKVPIKLPPDLQQVADRCPHKVVFDGDIVQLLEGICEWLDIRRTCNFPQMAGGTKPRLYENHTFNFCFDTTGWDLASQGGELVGGSVDGPIFTKGLRNGKNMTFNLVFGPAPPSWSRIKANDETIVARRKMQLDMAEVAITYMKKYEAVCKGVHLLYLDHYPGIPQFAMTYWFHRYWARRYSVVLENRYGENIEFAFHFGVPGTFREYCENTYLMDAVVRSLRWMSV